MEKPKKIKIYENDCSFFPIQHLCLECRKLTLAYIDMEYEGTECPLCKAKNKQIRIDEWPTSRIYNQKQWKKKN